MLPYSNMIKPVNQMKIGVRLRLVNLFMSLSQREYT